MVAALSDVAEDGCEKVNRVYAKILEADFTSAEDKRAVTDSVREDCLALMAEVADVRGLALCEKAFDALGVHPIDRGG